LLFAEEGSVVSVGTKTIAIVQAIAAEAVSIAEVSKAVSEVSNTVAVSEGWGMSNGGYRWSSVVGLVGGDSWGSVVGSGNLGDGWGSSVGGDWGDGVGGNSWSMVDSRDPG
ncbi:unnamed protein product, partial [Ixodes pacificus]